MSATTGQESARRLVGPLRRSATPHPAHGAKAGQQPLLYANPAMEDVLRRGRGLLLRQGQLHAGGAADQQRFAAHISSLLLATGASGEGAPDGFAPLILRGAAGEPGHLTLHAMRLGSRSGLALPAAPTVLLMAVDHAGTPRVPHTAVIQLYGLTRSEARLVQLLAEGQALRQAAQAMAVTYGTARGYLKIAFDKIGVRSQAQLASRVLADISGPA